MNEYLVAEYAQKLRIIGVIYCSLYSDIRPYKSRVTKKWEAWYQPISQLPRCSTQQENHATFCHLTVWLGSRLR
jgi:hypothetical protein